MVHEKWFMMGISPPWGQNEPRVQFNVDQDMSRRGLLAKPIEVTLGNRCRPSARDCLTEPNIMVFRKTQERSNRILQRMGVKDLTKIHNISCRQSAFKGSGARPWRSGNTDKALLTTDLRCLTRGGASVR